jgi:hypothetical protein
MGESILQGNLEEIKLATIATLQEPVLVKATVSVTSGDVYLNDSEGLWLHDISPNKHAVLTKKLILFLLDNYFQPYLSWTQLSSEPIENWHSLVDKKDTIPNEASLWQLERAIANVYQAKTEDLIELASLIELNPLVDFVAINLLGGELNRTC